MTRNAATHGHVQPQRQERATTMPPMRFRRSSLPIAVVNHPLGYTLPSCWL